MGVEGVVINKNPQKFFEKPEFLVWKLDKEI